MSPKSHRDRSASPQDMDISDDDSEDGMISRDQQQEERGRRLLGLSASASKVGWLHLRLMVVTSN